MLSCLLLAPQPGERALDMCAAPGSKTTQLLGAQPHSLFVKCTSLATGLYSNLLLGIGVSYAESVRGWSGADPTAVDEPDAGGLVVANDLDRELRAPALVNKFSCFAQVRIPLDSPFAYMQGKLDNTVFAVGSMSVPA